MPEAKPFSTNGVYNGLSGCPPSVDVSGFDFWTTASGYNKDSVGAPTQSQIDQSLHNVGKLFWNLHKVNVDTFYDTNTLTEQFVTGIVNGGVDDAIQPDERVCGGSVSTDEIFPIIEGQIDLRQTSGMQRFYNGSTTDEANFVGYGFGLIDNEAGPQSAISTITTFANDGDIVFSLVWLGGYSMDYSSPVLSISTYEYIERDGIHFLFLGHTEAPFDLSMEVNVETLTAETKNAGVTYTKAQITSLDFYTYPTT